MSEGDIAEKPHNLAAQGSGRSSAPVLSFPAAPRRVSFDRLELQTILNVYGRKVGEGEWRDYALDFLADKAVFSIYRRSSEVPLYRVEKEPRLARKQGVYSVVVASGLILKRGNDLGLVLRVIDKPLRVVAG
jgi:hypothetical protein